MSITVVVDGGGSGSRLAVFNAAGVRCATTASGPASLSLGVSQAWENIRDGLAQLRSLSAGSDSLPADWTADTLILGLAGALQQQRRDAFLALLPPATRTVLVSDGHAQLLGSSGGKPGACLAVGTGSVLHWLDRQGRSGMAGGWGFPAGDEASGAWLGLHCISRFVQARDAHLASDGTLPGFASDPLLLALQHKLGSEVSAIQHWSTCKNPTELATLVPLILSAAEQGSEVAGELLAQGARACESLLSLAPDDLPVYLVGGLAAVYEKKLAAGYRSRLSPPLGDVFDGLYSLADVSRPHDSAPGGGFC